jgi:hypothetical protein
MATPNWAPLADLKGPMYLNLTEHDATRDAALIKLGQMTTDQMISYLDNDKIDTSAPALSLQRACLEQCCYEWKQRATPGLQSVQMQDGSINKYQIDEWLKNVKKILDRYRHFALFETTTP